MRLLILLLALLLPLAACDGTDSVGPNPIAGSYALITLNGAALPATVTAAGPYRLEATSGELRLEGDGTFSISFSLRETTPDGVSSRTSASAGAYRLDQTSLLLRTSEGQEFLGTIAGNTVTLVIAGGVYVFQK